MKLEQAQRVWNMAHRPWPDGSVFRYFARSRRNGDTLGMVIDSPEMLASICTLQDKSKRDSYWQVNPTFKRDGSRCSTEDIEAWSFLLFDADPVDATGGTFEDALNVALEAKLELQDIVGGNVYDYHLIDSGRGCQIWIDVGRNNVPMHEAPLVMSHWLPIISKRVSTEKVHLDTSVSDLPRVMRMPFTINQKTGRRAKILEESWVGYPWVAQALHEKMDKVDFSRPEAALAIRSWPKLLPILTVAARVWLTEGGDYGGRHKGAYAALASLLEQGATEQAVRNALRYGALLCDPPLEQEEVDIMVDRKFRKLSA
jgi:hypothetical protein